jgi:hypothetical protein
MILVRLMGGLGNQMFQYAFGYCLAVKNKTILKIDTTLLDDRSQANDLVTHRMLDINEVFNLEINLATKNEVIYFNGKTSTVSFLDKVYHSLLYRLRIKNLIVEKRRRFNPSLLNLTDNKCLVGSWQCEKYFSNIAADIKSQFIFKNKLIKQSEDLAKNITESNSVCLHVRRGDYVTSPLYSKINGALELSYYNKAIKLISEKVSNPQYYIFSDDINWCKENLNFNISFIFVDDSHIGFKASNYLQLMTLCKHFIVSNSTFAWWGAWLGEKERSIIIGPDKWFSDKSYDSNDVLPERWIKI